MGCNSYSMMVVLYYFATICRTGSTAIPVRVPSGGLHQENRCSSFGTNASSQAGASHSIKDTIDSFLAQYRSPPPPCNGTGWIRVASLDMSDSTVTCPSNLTLHSVPVRGCGRKSLGLNSCDSVFYRLYGRSYREVCGRILAYQKGTPEAFLNYHYHHHGIESAYVDGVSLTHGQNGSRQHIWTFSGALYEDDPNYITRLTCPCTNEWHNWTHPLPQFMGNHYFCDTGNPGPGYNGNTYYTSDPLWDGEGCGPHSSCCDLNNPPWFHRVLQHVTSDDIELRVCFSSHASNEDVLLYLVDIYVK